MRSIYKIVCLIGGSLILLCLTVVFVYGQLDTVPRGVTFGNWDLSGTTKQQLEDSWDELERIWAEKAWTLVTPEPYAAAVQLKPEQFGLSVNNRPLLEQLNGLWEGPFWQRAWHRYQQRNKDIPFEVVIDEQILTETIATTWPQIETSTPVSATRRITSGDVVQYTADQPAYRVNSEQFAKALIERANALGLLVQHHQAEMFELNVPLRIIAAEVTLEALQAQKIERKIAEFTTTFSASKPGRIHNIQSTAQVVHDMLLAPEAEFDFGEVIAKTEKEHGFKPAPVIMNGKFVPGIGGGICQVSSTIYNAVLRAGLTIVERQHHSLPVRYVPLGQDATFASGHINFKFRNHARSHLLIRTETSDTHVTVKLFGSLPKEETYRVQSKVVETISPPVKYVQNKSLALGKQQVISRGTTGYIVETIRIRYVNGQEQDRELISKDHYRPQPTVIAIRDPGTNTKPNERSGKKTPPIIEDGVFGPVF